LLLYYITDRTQFAGSESQKRESLMKRIAEAARAGIAFIQLREKDLSAKELEELASEAARVVRASGGESRLLINSRTDVALASDADGVHLRSKDVSPVDVRAIWRAAGRSTNPIIAVSCHAEQDVVGAVNGGADFVVFGPVFEKRALPNMPVTGLEKLRAISKRRIPVLALGGVSPENARLCMEAGAAGIAGIRLFQQDDLDRTVSRLKP